MPNLQNVTAELIGGTIRIRGSKGSAVLVRAYVNPDLTQYPTNRDLYRGYALIHTPKAESSVGGETFDLSIPVGDAVPPYRVKVVSSDGKAATPLIEETPVVVTQARA